MTFHKVTLSLIAISIASARFASAASIEDLSLIEARARSPRSPEVGPAEDYSLEQATAGYRFGDEYFSHPGESASASGNLEHAKKADGCEKVVKDSMICMVCKDPKTNSKYEQCSYVSRPKERGQSYSSERSYSGKPKDSGDVNIGQQSREQGQTKVKTEDEPSYGRYESGEDDERSAYEGRSQEFVADEEEDDEKPRGRESSGYSNRKSGGEDDYRDEESFGEERIGQSSYETPNRRTINSEIKQNDNRSGETTDDEAPIERSSKKKNGANCRNIEKDSMICTVCEDPENGGNFEKCSYSHQPNDKLYKFTKSKSFGYPHTEHDDDDHDESSTAETKKVTGVVAGDATTRKKKQQPRCRRIRKNETMICNVCKNTITGESFEQCEYDPTVSTPTTAKKRTPRSGKSLPHS